MLALAVQNWFADPVGGAVGGALVAPGVAEARSGGRSVAEDSIGVNWASCVFCACTVNATDVAITDSFEADDPQAPSASARTVSNAVRL